MKGASPPAETSAGGEGVSGGPAARAVNMGRRGRISDLAGKEIGEWLAELAPHLVGGERPGVMFVTRRVRRVAVEDRA